MVPTEFSQLSGVMTRARSALLMAKYMGFTYDYIDHTALNRIIAEIYTRKLSQVGLQSFSLFVVDLVLLVVNIFLLPFLIFWVVGLVVLWCGEAVLLGCICVLLGLYVFVCLRFFFLGCLVLFYCGCFMGSDTSHIFPRLDLIWGMFPSRVVLCILVLPPYVFIYYHYYLLSLHPRVMIG